MALWHDLRTVFHLAEEVRLLRSRVEEMELEWLDKRDALDRLARRLNMRALRNSTEPVEAEVEAREGNSTPSSARHKDELRAAFREVMRR